MGRETKPTIRYRVPRNAPGFARRRGLRFAGAGLALVRMGNFIFVMLCLAAPFLLMWRLLAVQRRVRAMPRKEQSGYSQPYTDEVSSADGLVHAKSFEVNDELLAATRKADERSIVKDLEGRR